MSFLYAFSNIFGAEKARVMVVAVDECTTS
jgi:hypothetical protein